MSTLRKATICVASLTLIFAAAAFSAGRGLAQEGPGGAINPGRDCQTITSCQFRKGGSYRGCLSSYSCRVCRFVRSSCTIGGARKSCYESRCTWG